MEEKKIQQNPGKSNEERDQDEGTMNNGTIGGAIEKDSIETEDKSANQDNLKDESNGTKQFSAGENT